jgi:hypothetical protein
MTRHRRITGFVAIALMAIAATVSTTRSHLRSADSIVASAGAIATANFDDRWSAISASPSTEEGVGHARVR